MTRIPRLAFDVDGVFADFQLGFMTMIDLRFGTDYRNRLPEWVEYGSPSQHVAPFHKEHWDWGWKQLEFQPLFWAELPAYPEVDFQRLDIEMGTFVYNAYFITRRINLTTRELGDSNAQTRMWFENHGIHNSSAIVSSHYSANRLDVLKAFQADAYLDDHAGQFLEARANGIAAYLIDRPYNQDVDTPYRVKTVHEFVARATGFLVTMDPKIVAVRTGMVGTSQEVAHGAHA